MSLRYAQVEEKQIRKKLCIMLASKRHQEGREESKREPQINLLTSTDNNHVA